LTTGGPSVSGVGEGQVIPNCENTTCFEILRKSRSFQGSLVRLPFEFFCVRIGIYGGDENSVFFKCTAFLG
jgi:hypothetical protein